MTKRPRVSVIVCAYQTGEKIRATIEAILAQDYSDLELLVIDDASGDDTTDLVRSYTDERLKLIVNEVNLGVVGSRNKGLQLAQGDYIATCDHDDVWRQGKLTAQVEYMDTHSDCGVVGTGWLVHSPNRTTLNSNEDAGPALLKWRLLHRNCLLHSSLLMRRSVIEEHGISYHEACALPMIGNSSGSLPRLVSLGHLRLCMWIITCTVKTGASSAQLKCTKTAPRISG